MGTGKIEGKEIGQVKGVTAPSDPFDLATEEYQRIVNTIADNDLPLEIPNRHIGHAAILLNKIFSKAQRDVSVLTGSMPELFFDQIKSTFIAAIKRNVRVRLITIDDCDAGAALLEATHDYPGRIEVRQVNSPCRREVWTRVGHFAVSDGKRFRVEGVHGPKDFSRDKEVRAIACFNNPASAQTLERAFDSLWSDSSPIEADCAG